MRHRLLSFIFAVVLLISVVSASVTCSVSQISQTAVEGQTFSPSSTFSCFNNGNTTITIDKVGSFFSLSQSAPITVFPGFTASNLSVNFNSVTQGTYQGSLFFSDSSPQIPVSLSVSLAQQVQQSGVIVFPTNKIISVPQGTEQTENILINVPQNYPSSITIQSVIFNPGTSAIRFGNLNLGILTPGQQASIPIIFSGKNVQTGTYNTGVQIFATNSSGQVVLPTVNLQLQVTQGVTPLSNVTLADLPSCSLTSVDIGLNQTSSLVCSKTNPNIAIHPIIDTSFLIGVNTVTTDSQYVYSFRAKKMGSTDVGAQFFYQDGMIGDPFNQSIRISNTGSVAPGVIMVFQFFQNGHQKSLDSLQPGDTIIQVVDNATSSLVSNVELSNGGTAMTNNSLTLSPGVDYQIRAHSSGYVDSVVDVNASVGQIPFTLTPTKSVYNTGDVLNVESNLTNVSYTVNNQVASFPYTLKTSGNYYIDAIKDQYLTTELNISVVDGVYMIAKSPTDFKDWNVGANVIVDLNQNSSWVLNLNGTQINLGVGSRVSWKLDKPGHYEILSNGVSVFKVDVADSSFWSSIPWWGWGIAIIVILGIAIKIGTGKSESKEDDDLTPFY